MMSGWQARMPRLAQFVERLTATPAIPVLIAIVLGMYRIGDKSIWLDEAFSVALARAPTAEMIHYLRSVELHASPYYMVLHPWTYLGTSEAVVRALSVVFGVVAVLATWAVGKRYGVAFGAALILSVTPTFIEYEQEARVYTLLIAMSAIATLLYLRLTESWTLLRAVVYVLVAGLMIYLHPIGAFVVVAHGLAVLLFRPRREWPRMLAMFVPVVVLWLPMLRFALSNSDRISWIPPITLDSTFSELVVLGSGLVVSAVLLVMLVLGARRDVISLWLIVPIAGVIALSLFVQPALKSYYLLPVIPAAAIIAARNRPALIALLIAVSLVGVWNWYDRGVKDDWRGAAAWIGAQLEPGDGIVFHPDYLRRAYGYYASEPEPVWPAFDWANPPLLADLRDLSRFEQADRLWLVTGPHAPDQPEVTQALRAFVPVDSWPLTGPAEVRVTLMRRDPAPSE